PCAYPSSTINDAPLIILVILWLAIIFASFGYRAPRNTIVTAWRHCSSRRPFNAIFQHDPGFERSLSTAVGTVGVTLPPRGAVADGRSVVDVPLGARGDVGAAQVVREVPQVPPFPGRFGHFEGPLTVCAAA